MLVHDVHFFFHLCDFVSSSNVSPEGMKMRGTKNETNGSAKANKVVSDSEMLAAQTSSRRV